MAALMNSTTSRRNETPGERADRLHTDGYKLRRTEQFGVYWLTKPDKSKTYRVDVPNRSCNCQATGPCKHILYGDWFYRYDRARRKLAEVRRRGIEPLGEYEAELSASEWHLRRIVGAGAAQNERAA